MYHYISLHTVRLGTAGSRTRITALEVGRVQGSPFPTSSTLLDDDLSDDPPVLGVGRGVAVGLADRCVLQLQEEGELDFLKCDLIS